MNNPNENVSMALFCDFENVALGVRDTKFQKFDIRPVLERLLLKGSIVVKKAYCDWERYKEFKAPMHEANFELIEIPHVRQSGKNSADIRLVVDALDFCYTKSHVNTFVIISGDSDFSPLVSKLRENNKKVIGVGVKQSTSDLLIANCDEFIFYDDLAREGQRTAEARRDNRGASAQRRSPDEERRRKEEQEARKTRAVEMVVETFEALMAERGDSGKIWASALKDALKRRKPDFNESYYGFRAFGNLLEEAQSRGFLEVGREEKSGTYVYRDSSKGVPAAQTGDAHGVPAADTDSESADGQGAGGRNARKSRGGRKTASGRGAGSQAEGSERDEGVIPATVESSESAEAAQAWKQADAPQQTEDGTVVDVSETAGQMAGGESAEGSLPARNSRQADRHGRSGRRGRGAKATDDGRQGAQSGLAGDAPQPPASAAAQTTAQDQAVRKPEDVAPPVFSRPVPPPPQSALVSGPPPVVNVAEWTFVAPPANAGRERREEKADPFAGGVRRPAAEVGDNGDSSGAAASGAAASDAAASGAAAGAPAAKPARGARKTATRTQAKPKDAGGAAESQSTQAEPSAASAADAGAAVKPARKTARKTAPRKTAKKTESA